MLDLFGSLYGYYYLVIILQAVCVFHSVKRGNQSKWIWIIVFLPLIGSIAYIFTEIVKKQHVSAVQSGVASIVNPGGRIKDLERQLKFADTFNNRVALADAYFASGFNEKAIELYESSLTGLFSDNEHVIKQLVEAYYNVGRYEDAVNIAPKAASSMNFNKSRANLLYAKALEQLGKTDLAEKEYKAMNNRFSNYEARYNYAKLLMNANRMEEAELIFQTIADEDELLNRKEKGEGKIWIDKAKKEWSEMA